MNNSENLSTGVITANRWYHISATYDAGSQTQKLYVDGVLKGTNTSVASDTTATLYLATRGGTSRWWKGKMDDVKIYNYARTQKQILADYGTGQAQKQPVAYYKFDEGQGTTANNSGSGGAGLNGTLTGMSSPATSTSGWTSSGKFAKALLFDGSNDYVDAGNDSSINITGDLTLSAWVKRGTSDSNYYSIITKGAPSSEANYEPYRLILMGENLNTFTMIVSKSTSSKTTLQSPQAYTSTTNWYHITATYHYITDGTSVIKLYVNGVEVASSATAVGPIRTTSKNLIIGALSRDSLSDYFNGTIDEPKIYNYALTADEVKTEYNQGQSLQIGAAGSNTSYAQGAANQDYCVPGDTSTACAAPVAEWNFEEGSGTSVKDTSGNNNTGTWNGTGAKHWDVGKVGKAGKFNGSNDYVSCTDANCGGTTAGKLDMGTSNWTVETWVKTTSSSRQDIVTKYYDENPNNSGWYVAMNSDGTVRSGLSDVSFGSMVNSTVDGTTINNGQWHFVTVVFNRSGNMIRYVDGKATGTADSITTEPGSVNTDQNFQAGRRGNPTPYWFNGLIDQVKIFNYARSGAQIAWDYNKGAPIGHWQFDECQGSVAHDLSDNSNHGTITIGASGEDTLGTCTTSSTAWGSGATGKYNSSLSLDGTDDYVSIADSSSLRPTNITTSAWIYLSSLPSATAPIINNRSVQSGVQTYGWDFYVLESNRRLYFVMGRTDWNWQLYYSNSTISTGTWHHVVATADGTNVKLYIDGRIDSTTAQAQAINYTTGEPLEIGRYFVSGYEGPYWFSGQIDDVKIFNYALTASQVKTLYNNGAVSFGPATGAP